MCASVLLCLCRDKVHPVCLSAFVFACISRSSSPISDSSDTGRDANQESLPLLPFAFWRPSSGSWHACLMTSTQFDPPLHHHALVCLALLSFSFSLLPSATLASVSRWSSSLDPSSWLAVACGLSGPAPRQSNAPRLLTEEHIVAALCLQPFSVSVAVFARCQCILCLSDFPDRCSFPSFPGMCSDRPLYALTLCLLCVPRHWEPASFLFRTSSTRFL